tara:strand:+ start:167 stop:400 length:234 start_codon:yes stop_codon:yes gene_type:complete
MSEENYLMYLQKNYKNKMLEILNNEDLSIIEREFYAESSNWYTNQDPKSIIDTLLWLSNSNEKKKEILDEELNEYFN